MRATIWGCRGSLATPGRETVGYGGNTTSVELRSADDALVVLDAGTGIRRLGLSLAGEHPRKIDLLLTHMHLDHVEGLGFFSPLFDPDCTITIWGPRPDGTSLADHLKAYLSPPLFPVPFEQLPSTVRFEEIWEDTWEIADLHVTSGPVQHPGPTVGYRISNNGHSFAFIPDDEPGIDPVPGLALADGVDLLVHDAQYTAAEYATRVGWGHTALPDFVAFLRTAEPKRTVMFHHDPSHDDRTLEAMELEARDLAERESIELAREGAELLID